IDSNKVCIRDGTSPEHFELEKLSAINVFHPIKAVEYWQPNFSISVLFRIRNSKALSNFFGHAVSPRCPGISGNERTVNSGTCSDEINRGIDFSHKFNSHG